MAQLIQLKQIEQQFEFYRSGELPIVNGAPISFVHGWTTFNPATDWYLAQAWARCTQNQAGWVVGEIALLNGRRCTVSATSTNINVQIGANGVNIGRKNNNLNEFNLNPARWVVFVQGLRLIG